MFVLVTLPDLELHAAMEANGLDRNGGTAAALDPGDRRRSSRHRRITHVNRTARLGGVEPGMTVGLAVDLCPDLRLLRPDPVGAARAWEGSLRRIEAMGAELEAPVVGTACFDPAGLIPLYGSLEGVLEKVFEALDGDCLVGVGPTRLAAGIELAGSAREVRVISTGSLSESLDALPLDRLGGRLGTERSSEEELISSLRRLGVERLGEIRRLGRGPVTDRFGTTGAKAWEIASGREGPLRPRRPEEAVEATVDIPDDESSIGLHPALAIVSSRLSARLGQAGRAARSTRLEAELRDGGSWHCERSPKAPTSNPDLIRIPFEPAIDRIPGMPARLRLIATALAEASPRLPTLFEGVGESRRRRLDEAVRQVKAVVGDTGVMKVVETNPRSRLPERRVMLVPCETGSGIEVAEG